MAMTGDDELREAVETGVLGFVWSTGDAAAVADAVLALPEVAALRAQAAAVQRVRELAADLDDGSEWGNAQYPGHEVRTRILRALAGDDRAGQR